MKKIVIVSLLTFSALFSKSLSTTEIKNMVSKIKEERVGISLLKLEGTSNPFILKEKKKEPTTEETKEGIVPIVEVVYKVDAILNSAAFINKKWYKSGDKLGSYTVGHVSKNSVTLKSPNGNKILKLKKKKKNFIKLKQGYR